MVVGSVKPRQGEAQQPCSGHGDGDGDRDETISFPPRPSSSFFFFFFSSFSWYLSVDVFLMYLLMKESMVSASWIGY